MKASESDEISVAQPTSGSPTTQRASACWLPQRPVAFEGTHARISGVASAQPLECRGHRLDEQATPD
eukprot:scaffold9241_cov66-Phaeocystis_antarctica.AAC.4